MQPQALIESAYEIRETLTPGSVSSSLRAAIHRVIENLDRGKLRVAERIGDHWQVHEWLKKAILLYFRINQNKPIRGGFTEFYDKIPLKCAAFSHSDLEQQGVRIVPPATIRFGAYVGPRVVVMPSYINIGAYVDEGTLIDTWATVGSCAQIGKHVHISGGAGMGGVLEPLQAKPTIIEDGAFIGARSEIVEGVIVETGAVVSMGVFVGQSTPIYDRATGEISYGKIPAYSVVVPGSLPSKDGKYALYCAVIVKRVDEKTRSKVAINELLRV